MPIRDVNFAYMKNIIFLQGFHTPVAGPGRAGNIKNKGAVGEGAWAKKNSQGMPGSMWLSCRRFLPLRLLR